MESYSRLHVSFSSKASHSSVHTIYCKKHSVRQNSDVTPNLRTLFSLGWPPYCCPGDVESVFSRVGSIEKVFLMANPGSVDTKVAGTRVKTFCVGYVVFRAESDLDLALKLSSNSEVIPCPLSQVGLSKWMSQYMEERPKLSLLEDMAEVGVSCYDRQQEKVKLSRKRANVPDEDGWITVTKKNPKIDEASSSSKKKKKKAQVALHVYPWQLRESKRQQVVELRQKFEEDKKRVAIMRARRRFKPF